MHLLPIHADWNWPIKLRSECSPGAVSGGEHFSHVSYGFRILLAVTHPPYACEVRGSSFNKHVSGCEMSVLLRVVDFGRGNACSWNRRC